MGFLKQIQRIFEELISKCCGGYGERECFFQTLIQGALSLSESSRLAINNREKRLV